MRTRKTFYLIGLILLTVFLLAVIWEFVLEDLARESFPILRETSFFRHRWEEIILVVFFNGISLIALAVLLRKSIVQRMRAEDSLQKSEDRFKDIAEAASDWFWEQDENLRFTYHSERYFEITGFRPEDKIGTTRTRYVNPFDLERDADKWAAHLADLEAHRPFKNFEFTFTVKNGSVRHARISGAPFFGADGEFMGYRGTGTDITKRKRAEEKIEELAKIPEQNPTPVVRIAKDGTLFYANKPGAPLLEHWKCDIGRKVPEDWSRLIAEALKTGSTKQLEYECGAIVFLLSIAPFPEEGYVNVYGYNITAQKIAEEKVHKLSSAIEQSPAAVIITDTDGTIEYVNPTFSEITGYSSEEAIGQTPRMLKSGETPEAVYERLWADITAGKVWRGMLRNKRKDGTVYLAGVTISPIVAQDGTVTNFIGTHQDITQRVANERRLKQVDKMESLGGLAGGIAHDFNNMLLPILSLTNMTRKALPEDSRERLRLDKVIEAGTQAKDLVARILTFSRQEDAVTENIDIHAIIRESMELLRATLPTTLKIKERLDKNTGTVLADSAQISSVLLNLATNASDAMDGKTGEMTVSLSPVKVGRKESALIPGLREGKYAKLAVKDNGHGMDEETLARVREPFFTTKEVGKGTGLGLSMVQGIVSKHAGTIHIMTAPGKGTTIEVYLPLVEGEADHETRDGDDVSRDVRKTSGSSHQPEAAMEKQA